MPNLAWLDFDGDFCRIKAESVEEDATVIASILTMDNEEGHEAEAYVSVAQARDLIEWLTALLALAEQRRKGPS